MRRSRTVTTRSSMLRAPMVRASSLLTFPSHSEHSMRFHSLAAALAGAGLLAACGGSTDSPAASPTGPITLTGVVAKGAALVSASVTAKCAVDGSAAPAITTDTGSYTITIAAGALPCVLEATSTDTVPLVLPCAARTIARFSSGPPRPRACLTRSPRSARSASMPPRSQRRTTTPALDWPVAPAGIATPSAVPSAA